MLLSRRDWLHIVTAATACAQVLKPASLDLAHLMEPHPATQGVALDRRYLATANILLFGASIFSRAGVGEGYARFEDKLSGDERSLGTEFGAGSFPDKSKGLNKLGVIREAVQESHSGERIGCAYFGFMTTSQEKNLDEAKKSLDPSGATVPYSIGWGTMTPEAAVGNTTRVVLPAKYSWRDCDVIRREVMQAIANHKQLARTPLDPSKSMPGTFLYAVRKAIQNPGLSTSDHVVFNGRRYILTTTKQPDASAGAQFVKRKLTSSASRVMRLNGNLVRETGDNGSAFRVWFERGAENLPPLRFDYQARSFLRLTFDAV